MKKILPVTILFTILTSGCLQMQPLPTSTMTPRPTITRTSIPTLTATFTPTLQPTTTYTPTLTSLPTLQANEAIKKAKELLETNNRCTLPCFWGITPGITTWDYTNSFLQTFSTIESDSNNGGEFYLS